MGQAIKNTLISSQIGWSSSTIRIDVTQSDTIWAASERIKQEYGLLDILINNAGISLDKGASPKPVAIIKGNL
jgi:NADP-dependent 3-hydroxy acid dehydrogenase YdfG